MDCSFIPKSGKVTYGLDWFYNGSQSRTQKGLEISVITVIDVDAHRAYSLSVQQTPAPVAKPKAKAQSQHQRITGAMLEQAQQMLEQLPIKAIAEAEVDNAAAEPTRMDYYCCIFTSSAPDSPPTSAGLNLLIQIGKESTSEESINNTK
jgi:hypothetical protein